MNVKGLADVFVASGVNEVNEKTFTALFYGYEIRGKVRVPSVPTVEFFFYGNVFLESRQQADEFINGYEEKYDHAKFRFSDRYVSIMFDIGNLDAPKVKERLAAVGNFMISNGFGAIALQPEEPEPEPEPAPAPQQTQAKPQPKMQPQQQRPVQQQPQRQAPQQPVYQEPKVPFEDYKVLDKLTQIFLLGVNKVTDNTFTTLYHGYNVVGKLLSPVKDDIEVIFYGELTQNATEAFEAFQNEMNEKYGRVPMRMVGGSCDAILYLDGKDVAQCKEMLGQISGFMMKNSIVAVNLPNTIGRPVASYTAESLKHAREQARLGGNRSMPSPSQSSYGTPPTSQGAGQPYNSGYGSQQQGRGVGKFFKGFGKKP